MTNLRSTAYVTLGILTGSFFSYLLQLFLANRISVADFGAFNAILSIAAIVAVPATVFSTALIKKVAELKNSVSDEEVSMFYWQSSYYLLVIGILIFFVFLLFGEKILNHFNIVHTQIHVVLGALLGFSYIWMVPYAFLQGLMRYKRFAVYLMFNNFTRLILPVLLVIYSYSMSNLFIGILMATIISYLFSFILLSEDIKIFSIRLDFGVLRSLLIDLLPVLLLNLSTLAMMNIDQILIKKFFDPTTAGYYAGAVTLGKIFLFTGTAVTTVMYPKITAAKNDQITLNNSFKYFFRLQVLVTIVGVSLYVLFPKIISSVFFGDKLLQSSTYLSLYSIFVAMFLNVNFLSLVMVALDSTKFTFYMLPIVLAQYFVITLYHNDVFSVMWICASFATLLFVYLLLNTLKTLKKHRL